MARKVKAFEYGGYHFVPVRQFREDEDGFYEINRRLCHDPKLGFYDADYNGDQKYAYSPSGFYMASTDKSCDIFHCVENGFLYVPCEHELQRYEEKPQKRRVKEHER